MIAEAQVKAAALVETMHNLLIQILQERFNSYSDPRQKHAEGLFLILWEPAATLQGLAAKQTLTFRFLTRICVLEMLPEATWTNSILKMVFDREHAF